MLIEFRDVSFSYPENRLVLDGINFTLNEGENIALLGANGSGKTTLLHLIVGLLKPAEGEISIFDKVRRMEKDFLGVRRRIGLVFQDPDDQLFCPTVAEDIAFGPLNLGKSYKEVKLIVKETLNSLNLSHIDNRITYKLSGGEKRLVSFATVLAMEPEILLLDEPTKELDEETERRITKILKERDFTTIVASHDKAFLKQVCNKGFILKDHRLEQFELL